MEAHSPWPFGPGAGAVRTGSQQGTETEPENREPKPHGLDSIYLVHGLAGSGKTWPPAVGSETSQPEG